MFGEKYPSVVRVVEFAGPWSRELCGGTHVANTAQIGVLNLLSESSIGSGVRRVEALVAQDAFERFAAERALVATLTDNLRVQPEQLVERVDKLLGSGETDRFPPGGETAGPLRGARRSSPNGRRGQVGG